MFVENKLMYNLKTTTEKTELVSLQRFALCILLSIVFYSLCIAPSFADIFSFPSLPSIPSMTSTGSFKDSGGASVTFTTTPTGWVLCNLSTITASYVGKGLATLAVIFLGISAAMGKITWVQAVLLGIGLISLFGAGTIVDYVVGDGRGCKINDVTPENAISSNPVADALCHVAWALSGTTGKGLMTIAVIITGIGAGFQKITWGQAALLGVGIAMVFGSTVLISNLTGNNNEGCFDPTKASPAAPPPAR